MEADPSTPPTVQEASQWPTVKSHYQADNGCHVDIKSENPHTIVPAYPDLSKTTLLAKVEGKSLIELPDGTRVLMCSNYDKN